MNKLNKARATSMLALAGELGMTYEEKDSFSEMNYLSEFRVFRKSSSNREAFNVMNKKDDFLESVLTIMDMTWAVSTGKTSQRFYQTVFFLRAKDLGVPDFSMRPESFFHKIGTMLGMQDIDFEAYPEFSDHNLIQGSDPDLIRSHVVNPGIAKVFQFNKTWTLEGMGYFLVLYKYRTLLCIDEVKSLIIQGMDVYRMLKNNTIPFDTDLTL